MSVINDIIEQWLDQGRAFTAYEVTLEARKQGEKGRHKDLKNIIHLDTSLQDAVNFGDYLKTNVDVGASTKAILYHPDTYDPTSYQALPKADEPSTPVQVPVTPATSVLSSGTSTPVVAKTGHCLDYRNRLFIPKSYLADIGVSAGEKVSIFNEGSLVVVRKAQDGDVALSTLKVEKDGEIRIAQSTLVSGGLTCSQFNIEAKNNTLEIKAS